MRRMMHISSNAMVLFVITVLVLAPSSVTLEIEKQALLRFKSNLHDSLNHLESWNSSNSPCQFFGSLCDSVTRKVTGISLDNLQLEGNISSSLSNLQTLTSLNLSFNSFTGSLPSDLKKLTRLQYFNLSNNYLIGEIPDLSTLVRLKVFDLSHNDFSGKFPVWIGNFTSLVVLGLGSNDYEESKIPSSIARLKNLTHIFLGGANLRGELPDWMFELTSLEDLQLQNNNLSGRISSSISQLTKLTVLELYFNNFTSELPREIGNLTLLLDFDISGNQFHGSLPSEMVDLKSLKVFHAYKNNFSGHLPKGFGYMMPNLSSFSIYKNNFSGDFPRDFGKFSSLSLIDISENKFTGEFPPHLCENRKLDFLLALDNRFTGDFPESYSNCKSLTRLRVSKNFLYGKIPDGLWAMPHLDRLDLSRNNFTGSITSLIGISTNLSQIDLSDNRFSGLLPQEIGDFSKLERLVLSNNDFNGEIPNSIRYLKQLSRLQLDDNSFNGSIPSEVGECTNLAQIDLAMNSLTGSIPSSISKLSLNSFNISRNKLSGLIPTSLSNLKLSLMDLSDNLLSGVIPVELYMIGGDSGFMGNERLCLDHNLILHFDSKIKECKTGRSPKGGNFRMTVLWYALPSTIALLIICLLVIVSFRRVLLLHRKKRQDDDQKWIFKIFQPRFKIDVSDMKRLNTENIIGRGGQGIVYKLDYLEECGHQSVAVKVVQAQGNNKEMLKSMSKEIETLDKVRHKNVLKLYAYFKRGRSHYLVLELMERGNLYEALHHGGGEASLDRVLMDMDIRYKIAVGVAQGIAYLHHDCSLPIIHADIKSNNILLNRDYEPKISDFGIAKCSDINTNSMMLMGTHGYMAPELAYTTKATEKSDVYSFGVVLLELLTGKNPSKEEFGEGRDMVSWVHDLWCNPNGVVQVIDERLQETLTTKVINTIRKVMQIALQCTLMDPSQRPSMKDVVKVLHD